MSSSNEPVFHVRDYRFEDFAELCEIDKLSFSPEIAYSPEEIALGMMQPGAFVLVAEAQSRIAGFVLAYQKRRAGQIMTIDVRSEFQKLGVGGKLMEMAEERLRRSGAARIILEVSVHNENAMRFYQKLGYTAKNLLPNYYPDRTNAWRMEKLLS